MVVETPTLSETTLLANEEKAFALEPLPITRRHNSSQLTDSQTNSHQTVFRLFLLDFQKENIHCFFSANSGKKRGKRKRKLVVDQAKELSNESIRAQLSDFSELVAPMDLAPPTLQLMLWKENGGAAELFAQPCSTVVSPQLNEVNQKEQIHQLFLVVKPLMTSATIKSHVAPRSSSPRVCTRENVCVTRLRQCGRTDKKVGL